MGIAPSIVGTATRSFLTPIRAYTTIFSICPSSSNASPPRRLPERISRAGATDLIGGWIARWERRCFEERLFGLEDCRDLPTGRVEHREQGVSSASQWNRIELVSGQT